jgi:hypothetical protein
MEEETRAPEKTYCVKEGPSGNQTQDLKATGDNIISSKNIIGRLVI